jgi:hypothetical protein
MSLSKTNPEKIQKIRNWGKERAIQASRKWEIWKTKKNIS